MKPLRLLIQEAVTTALADISIVNGYEHDLVATSIFRGRTKFGVDDPLPAVTMFEPPVNDDIPVTEQRGSTGGTRRMTNYTLIVQGFVKDGNPHPTDPAYTLSADVVKALAKARSRKSADGRNYDPFGLGNYLREVTILPVIVRPSDDISATAYFWMSVVFKIIEDTANPMM